MTIYEALSSDHLRVLGLIRRLETEKSPSGRQQLIKQIRDDLIPHSRAEEAVLYNVLKDMDEARDLVSHGYQEHIMAETVLRGLQVTEAVAVKWETGVRKLHDDLAHHIAEEEGDIYAAAKQVFSKEDAESLGKAFMELKPKLGAGLISSQVELMANLMPKQFRKRFVDNLSRSDITHEAS